MTTTSKQILFVLNEGPYGSERPYNALRHAMELAKDPDLHVRPRTRWTSLPASVKLWTTFQAQPTPTGGPRRGAGGGTRTSTTLSSSWLSQMCPLHIRLLRLNR